MQNVKLENKALDLFKAVSEMRWAAPPAEGESEEEDGNPIVANSIRSEQRRAALMLQDHRWRYSVFALLHFFQDVHYVMLPYGRIY